MVPELDVLRREFEKLRRRFLSITTQHVNRAQDREAVRQFVQRYFREHRRRLVSSVGDDSLRSFDSAMQDLLRCTHGRRATTKYRGLLKACATGIRELESCGDCSSRAQELECFWGEGVEAHRHAEANVSCCVRLL